jgi:DNA-binding transcriptional ArsR family regulator
MGEAIRVIQDSECAAAMLHPLRLRILELAAEPCSATSLAPRIGLPRQHVNYHLRELEKAGLVELVEERRRGNCTERLYQSRANSFVIGPRALGEMRANPAAIADKLSSEYLVALGSKLIEDIGALREERDSVPTLAIETRIAFASEQERGQFAQELAQAVVAIAGRYHVDSPEAQPFRLVLAAHPESLVKEQLPRGETPPPRATVP